MRGILGLSLPQQFMVGAAIVAVATATPAAAQTRGFDVPAEAASQGIPAFAKQAGVQIIASGNVVRDRRTNAVRGIHTVDEGLRLLLNGTGLVPKPTNETGIITIIRSAEGNADAAETAASKGEESAPTQSTAAADGSTAILVTGSRVRGGRTASPVITISAKQIREEGFTDLGEVIRSIPQNFSGGQNPGVAAGAGQGGQSNQNLTGGSGLNLRGLGPDATLTLLNGRRMSYGGAVQAVDISAIPVDAIERLEIVPDGASAIYGSDAVGGVANVILKRDFHGVTVGARYGGATDGGLTTHEYNATAGATWSSGGLIVAGEKTSNDPIYSDQRDYTQSMYRPSTLWQGGDLRSGLLSLHQSLGDAVELHLDALRSERNMDTATGYASIYYLRKAKTKTILVAPSLEVRLPGDWTLTLGGAVGADNTSYVQPTVNSTSGAVTAHGLGAYRNKSLTYEIGAEGPLFRLPGGEARLAAGAGYRRNDFLYMTNNTTQADDGQSGRFAYAELSLPLVGPKQGIGGIERLALTGAVRAEDGDYGRVTTPKLGVIYSPSADFSLKTSWGKSFKAPTLLQRYLTQNAIYYPAATFGAGYPADATALWLSGGSADLSPERARTWSASLAFHPEALTGLEMELTGFDIDYTERVVQPITGTAVLGNPIYAEFVDYDPTEPAQAAALANASNFYNFAGTPYDASKVVAIVDGRYVNAARQRTKGLDLSGSYRTEVGTGRMTIRGSVSWLDSTQQLTAAQSPHALAGTLFYPPKLSGRLGAVWDRRGLSAAAFVNYKGGVRDLARQETTASFTTVDAALRYTINGQGPLSGLSFALSAQNLLNRAPPLYVTTSLTNTPYDSTNYSAVGRFLSLSVSKHW
jgi:outer membrane receptor protein involved in Fe transport